MTPVIQVFNPWKKNRVHLFLDLPGPRLKQTGFMPVLARTNVAHVWHMYVILGIESHANARLTNQVVALARHSI